MLLYTFSLQVDMSSTLTTCICNYMAAHDTGNSLLSVLQGADWKSPLLAAKVEFNQK